MEPVAIQLTSPERVVYPDDGITKREVFAYMQAMAGPLLAALADRPLALERWPNGVGETSWYQQHIGAEGRDWMELAVTPTRSKKRPEIRHLVAHRVETLLWMAQMNVLTIHMWSSRRASPDAPDWVIFDFDPAAGRAIDQAILQAIVPAHALRRLLDKRGLRSVVKTSGKRGLHVLVPLPPGDSYDRSLTFALELAERLCRELPDVTLERSLAERHGRLYLDVLQNGKGKTIVAPYSPRGVPGAPVSAPITWDEVTPALDPRRFTIRTMPGRLREVGDLFAPALSS